MNTSAQKIDIAEAATQLYAAAARLGPRERRRFRRMPIVVAGRMLDRAGREHDCRTADISPGDVRIAAAALPEVDETVVLYLDGFGRLSGRVARRCGEGEVAIIFDTSVHKREKMAETLTWAVNKAPLNLEETPKPAIDPNKLARIQTEDGGVIEGEVLDFSLAGVTIRTSKPPPPIGAWVRIGGAHGRVARFIEGGFAIDLQMRGAGYRTVNTSKTD
ncbi:MAG: PilZ domain-containing protein [Hyphomonadaceae bacterium]